MTLYIQPLIDFCTSSQLTPHQALKLFAVAPQQAPLPQQFQTPQPQFMYPQPAHLSSPMNEMSPMPHHAVLPPGTTMTGSPHTQHYPSPMSSQTSQTGASATNTTPLMSNRPAPAGSAQKAPAANKRRRASAVASNTMKEEDEEGMIAGAVGKQHPKQSPRIGMGRGGGPGGPGKRMRGDS